MSCLSAAGNGSTCTARNQNQVSALRDGIVSVLCCTSEFIAPNARVFVFESISFTIYVNMEVTIAMCTDGDYQDNLTRLTLMWRERKAEEIAF